MSDTVWAAADDAAIVCLNGFCSFTPRARWLASPGSSGVCNAGTRRTSIPAGSERFQTRTWLRKKLLLVPAAAEGLDELHRSAKTQAGELGTTTLCLECL